MKKYMLIVNPSGSLSACPSETEFKKFGYHTDNMHLVPVLMDDQTRATLWSKRETAYILPYASKLPAGSTHFTVLKSDPAVLVGPTEGQIDEGYGESLTYEPCIGPLCRGGSLTQGEANTGSLS